nr:hypothetical protein [uncultured Sphaerochaeta sp.]
MSIERKRLVQQMNPKVHAWDPDSFLSVGNGNFAYTVDCTGTQSQSSHTKGKTPLCTMSSWGLHNYPGKEEKHYDRLILKQYEHAGRTVGYMSDDTTQEALFHDLRVNPHRCNLAHIGLQARTPDDMKNMESINQELDLWSGIITSDFQIEDEPVQVHTLCHPRQDQLSFRVRASLLAKGTLNLAIRFPYPSHDITASNYTKPDAHHSELIDNGRGRYCIKRTVDTMQYEVHILLSTHASIRQSATHEFMISASQEMLEVGVLFQHGQEKQEVVNFSQALDACTLYWASFWQDGAFIDLSSSSDPRAQELQRRMILSRYLLAIQCSGNTPPPETGLTCNSWYGKFHLEMHLLHAAHFALFGQPYLLERSLSYYLEILPGAYERAKSQGYQGGRWPKMTDPSGNDSPSAIGTLLCWQQPHPIFYGSLLRKTHPESSLLLPWAEVVRATADFMVDYVIWDEQRKSYIIGPPVIPVQENHDPEKTVNPTFELSYWRWALSEAIDFMEQFGQPVDPKWKQVMEKLSPLPMNDGAYLAQENCSDTYGAYAYDHPSLLFSLGLLDGRDVYHKVMEQSLMNVMENWQLNELWGWDFPLMAMTAARLGKPELALDLLLMDSPKNTYTANGHNAQRPKEDLPLYLPGNGALLLALALMAGGWEGSETPYSGFPRVGWIVQAEGLKKFW